MNRNDLPAPNMTCEVCGRKYRRCKKCAELRNKGIEAWREHCDSIECYQTLLLTQIEDLSTITKDEYETVISFELPDGRDPIKSIQKRLDEIRDYLYSEKKKEKEENESVVSKETAHVEVEGKKETQAKTETKSYSKQGSWKQSKHNKWH